MARKSTASEGDFEAVFTLWLVLWNNKDRTDLRQVWIDLGLAFGARSASIASHCLKWSVRRMRALQIMFSCAQIDELFPGSQRWAGRKAESLRSLTGEDLHLSNKCVLLQPGIAALPAASYMHELSPSIIDTRSSIAHAIATVAPILKHKPTRRFCLRPPFSLWPHQWGLTWHCARCRTEACASYSVISLY